MKLSEKSCLTQSADVGKDFRLTKETKICSLQAKRTQLEFNVFSGSRVNVKRIV